MLYSLTDVKVLSTSHAEFDSSKSHPGIFGGGVGVLRGAQRVKREEKANAVKEKALDSPLSDNKYNLILLLARC